MDLRETGYDNSNWFRTALNGRLWYRGNETSDSTTRDILLLFWLTLLARSQ
jgi:hypothetical protein